MAAVGVDAPVIDGTPGVRKDQSQTLAAMLKSAAIRYSRAEVEAITDGLTGLYNHRYLHDRLAEELRRAARRGSKLAVLSTTATTSRPTTTPTATRPATRPCRASRRISEAHSRRIDLAARYGGEEFVLALINTDTAAALKVGRRICAEVGRNVKRGPSPD